MKEQIEVITYEQDRLNYFTDLMKKAQERYIGGCSPLAARHADFQEIQGRSLCVGRSAGIE